MNSKCVVCCSFFSFFFLSFIAHDENIKPTDYVFFLFVVIPSQRRLELSMTQQEQFNLNKNELKCDLYSLENLSKISSFATLNSSMLFMPKSPPPPLPTTSYINQKTVAKVMKQQLLKKELLSDTVSISSSLTSSPFVHIRQRYHQKQKSDDTLSSGDSSTSSQRDSGLSSGINDELSDTSPRNSLIDNEQIEHMMSKLKKYFYTKFNLFFYLFR
jgi:hypothetical protein